MTDDFDRDPLAQQLRASLARHADQAPAGELLAERIIRAAEAPRAAAARHGRGWRTWMLPLVAAAAVAGVVAGLLGIENYHPTATPPAGSPAAGSPLVASPAAGSSRPQHSVPRKPELSPTSSAPVVLPPRSVPAPPAKAGELTGVKVADLTFVSDDEGWALASAHCLSGRGRCTAILHTTDGTDWSGVSGSAFNVPGVSAGCRVRCVKNIRFANSQVGYAFGPKAFFMTTDGGADWRLEPGGAIALETLDQNVIRVTSPHPGCPSWCDIRVETSGIPSTTWTPVPLSANPVSAGADVQLARGAHNAYLLVPGHVSGGALSAPSALFRSTDDGRTWHESNDPCLPASQPVAAIGLAAGAADRVSALCEARTGPSANSSARFMATSADAGARFTPQADLPGSADVLTGDPATVLVAVTDRGMLRSADGGKTWHRVADVSGPVGWVGFESPTVGRAVSGDGSTIWTTRDGGVSWQATRFG